MNAKVLWEFTIKAATSVAFVLFTMATNAILNMSDSIHELNKQIAVIIAEIGYHSATLKRHEEKIAILEQGKTP